MSRAGGQCCTGPHGLRALETSLGLTIIADLSLSLPHSWPCIVSHYRNLGVGELRDIPMVAHQKLLLENVVGIHTALTFFALLSMGLLPRNPLPIPYLSIGYLPISPR
jgi:hypothetical protein